MHKVLTVAAVSLAMAGGVVAKERNIWQVPKGSVCENAIQEHFEQLHLADSAVFQVRAEKGDDGVHFAPDESTPYSRDMAKGSRWWPIYRAKAPEMNTVVKAASAGQAWMEVTGYDLGDGSLGTNKSPFSVQIFVAAKGRCFSLLSNQRDMVLPSDAFPPFILGW